LFTLFDDPQLANKLRAVVGCYVIPPDHAIVLPVGGKSKIRALDRTQPGFSMKKGCLGVIGHDDEGHASATRLATVNKVDGTVMRKSMESPRHRFRFLNAIDARAPRTPYFPLHADLMR
jgi:hypothetical protein